jgi:hypothetical protein
MCARAARTVSCWRYTGSWIRSGDEVEILSQLEHLVKNVPPERYVKDKAYCRAQFDDPDTVIEESK